MKVYSSQFGRFCAAPARPSWVALQPVQGCARAQLSVLTCETWSSSRRRPGVARRDCQARAAPTHSTAARATARRTVRLRDQGGVRGVHEGAAQGSGARAGVQSSGSDGTCPTCSRSAAICYFQGARRGSQHVEGSPSPHHVWPQCGDGPQVKPIHSQRGDLRLGESQRPDTTTLIKPGRTPA
jgi:hypothetical protein